MLSQSIMHQADLDLPSREGPKGLSLPHVHALGAAAELQAAAGQSSPSRKAAHSSLEGKSLLGSDRAIAAISSPQSSPNPSE